MSSDLRTQFLNYMTLQRFSPHTQRGYIAAVKGLANFYKKSPDLLTNDAFKQAKLQRQPLPGLIVHSDCGSQYCSRSFKELLGSNRYRQSMSSTGNCYDNAITEIIYNRIRIHSALGDFSPNQFEQMNNFA